MKTFITGVESLLAQASLFRRAYAKYCMHMFSEQNFSPCEIDILIFLSNNEHMNTSKELAFYLNRSKALICRSVDRLIRRDLVFMQEDENDHRIHLLYLKEDSGGVVKAVKECQKTFARDAMRNIDDAQLQLMLKTMYKINENLRMIMEGDIYDKES